MAGVQVYKSTDGSAPTLNGTVGSLVALLDACLVVGYGAKAAAGWTKPFTGTNAAVFRNSATLGTGFYLDVNDNGPGAGVAREARLRGYEVMTAVATGTNPFPTVAQATNGLFVRKSITADTTARAWTIVADETVFYLFIETGDFTAPVSVSTFAFGDFFSYKTSDAYRCIIIGRLTENSGSTADDSLARVPTALASMANTVTGHYVARSWSAIGGSLAVGKVIDYAKCGTGGGSGTCIGRYVAGDGMTYPNGPDSGLYLSPIWINHSSAVRGYLKGLWAPLQNRPLSHNDTFSGTGVMSAKTFLVQDVHNSQLNSSTGGQVMVETTNTWS